MSIKCSKAQKRQCLGEQSQEEQVTVVRWGRRQNILVKDTEVGWSMPVVGSFGMKTREEIV